MLFGKSKSFPKNNPIVFKSSQKYKKKYGGLLGNSSYFLSEAYDNSDTF